VAYFCLHGWSGDHRTFDPLLPYLPGHARMYSADLPGCGASAPPARWELGVLAAEIARDLSRCPEPVTLVGNCMGALLGMRAALLRPDRVARLVLIDAFARWPWYFRVFAAPHWGKYAYRSTFSNPIGRWITNRSLASKRNGDSNLTNGFAGARGESPLRYLNALGDIRSAEEFAALTVPVDVVFGARTFQAARQSAAVWKRLWPWASVYELEGAGHLPIREASAALSEILFGRRACEP
jgi:pimeloyl-ACP methyl ester carboxylesterase